MSAGGAPSGGGAVTNTGTGAEPRTRDFEEHGRLVELVVAGGADQAAALMRSHIDHSLTAAALATEAGEEALSS